METIGLSILRLLHSGNDTIDHYPPAVQEIKKVLCVSERTLKKIQVEFKGFWKTSEARKIFKPKQQPIKSKNKIVKKVIIQKSSHFEPNDGIDALRKTRNHCVGRIKDWYELYGQGMYE